MLAVPNGPLKALDAPKEEEVKEEQNHQDCDSVDHRMLRRAFGVRHRIVFLLAEFSGVFRAMLAMASEHCL